MSALLRHADLEANKVWVACGQVALAALLRVPLSVVRPVCPGHAWMNQTDMRNALRGLGVAFAATPHATAIGHLRPRAWPRFGLVQIQFRGPWEVLDASMATVVRRSLRYSHWVAVSADPAVANVEPIICDINAVDRDLNGGWLPRSFWERWILAPLIEASSKKATGGWWVRSALEVDRVSAAALLEGTR